MRNKMKAMYIRFVSFIEKKGFLGFSDKEKMLIRRCFNFTLLLLIASLVLYSFPVLSSSIYKIVNGVVGGLVLITDFVIIFPPFSIIVALLSLPFSFFIDIKEPNFDYYNLFLNNLFFFGCLVLSCSIKRYKRIGLVVGLVASIVAYWSVYLTESYKYEKITSVYYYYCEYMDIISLLTTVFLSLVVSHYLRKSRDGNMISLNLRYKFVFSLFLLCIYFLSVTHNSYFITLNNIAELKLDKEVILKNKEVAKPIKVEEIAESDIPKDAKSIDYDYFNITHKWSKKVATPFYYHDNKRNSINKIMLPLVGGDAIAVGEDRLLLLNKNYVFLMDVSHKKPKIITKYKLPDEYYNDEYYNNKGNVLFDNGLVYISRYKKSDNYRHLLKINLDRACFDDVKTNSELNFLSSKYIVIYSTTKTKTAEYLFKNVSVFSSSSLQYVASVVPMCKNENKSLDICMAVLSSAEGVNNKYYKDNIYYKIDRHVNRYYDDKYVQKQYVVKGGVYKLDLSSLGEEN